MNFEFQGTSDLEKICRKPEKHGKKIRFLRTKRPKPKGRKKQSKHGKRDEEQRRAIRKLCAAIDTMQAEINDLKNYDKDGFPILRRRRDGL